METHRVATVEAAKESPKITCLMKVPSSSLRSLELLKIYWGKKKLSGEMTNEQSLGNTSNLSEVSTACIMKIARVKLLQQASQNSDFFYTPSNDFPGLSSKDIQNVELAEFLQASAEKVALREFDRAQMLLKMCGCGASETGNPIQRLVFYFGRPQGQKQ
ncbi:hypothetical protein Leryth_025381 [Lithospermum erythrorhizon]|nr:hypothetical protein Leryth_025381 [Lithospermum erythrorhizon]